MFGCDVLFKPEAAEKVRAEVAKRMGGVCPCMADEPCPLLAMGSPPIDLGPTLKILNGLPPT